jgi:hypothetical protein
MLRTQTVFSKVFYQLDMQLLIWSKKISTMSDSQLALAAF